LNINLAIPCGLIINELLSNALKYAFPADRSGRIEIEFEQPNTGKYIMAVRDDGVGMPAAFDLESTETLGLKLVRNLTQQLHGDLKFTNSKGTEFVVKFEDN